MCRNTGPQELLKAYPKVKIKVGGYTDNTGDKASNMALSSARATTVLTALVQGGIDKSRLSAEGYGEALLRPFPGATDRAVLGAASLSPAAVPESDAARVRQLTAYSTCGRSTRVADSPQFN